MAKKTKGKSRPKRLAVKTAKRVLQMRPARAKAPRRPVVQRFARPLSTHAPSRTRRRDHDRKGGASAGGLEGFFDGNGLDLMRRLQSNRPIRGIAISGFGTEQDLRRSREAGYE
jgi:hypothetical protein